MPEREFWQETHIDQSSVSGDVEGEWSHLRAYTSTKWLSHFCWV